MKLKSAWNFLVILAALAGATAAQASPVIWDLEGLTFSDGGSGGGYFVFDAASETIADWRIGTFAGFLYTPFTSVAVANSGGCTVDFLDANWSLCLNPAAPLNAGDTPVLLQTSNETSPSGRRFVVAGTLQDPPEGGGDAIPEPGTALPVACALAAMFFGFQRFIFLNNARYRGSFRSGSKSGSTFR